MIDAVIDEIKNKQAELNELLERAAKKLLSYWPGNPEGGEDLLHVAKKADNTLVSEADFASNKIMLEGLNELFPSIPIKSEESDADASFSGNYFLVDPLDGTARFLEGADDFAILLAYIDDKGFPVAGWMHFPARNECLWAIGGENGSTGKNPLGLHSKASLGKNSVYLRWGGDEVEFSSKHPEVNGESLHSGEGFYRFLTGSLGGIALKLGRLGPWDIAAPAAITRSLGGTVVEGKGDPFLFVEETPEQFLCTTEECSKELLKLVEEIG